MQRLTTFALYPYTRVTTVNNGVIVNTPMDNMCVVVPPPHHVIPQTLGHDLRVLQITYVFTSMQL